MLEPELKQRYTESLTELQRAVNKAARLYEVIEQQATADELIELILEEQHDKSD